MFINRIIYVFGLLFFGLCVSLYAQNKLTLEQQKNEALKNIKEAEQILSQTSKKKASSLGQLRALNKQIESRQMLINSIKKEIQLSNEEIEESQIVITSLEADLKNLKAEYGSMVYASYKSMNSYDKLSFVFSAASFNQFLMRIKYLEQYTNARRSQVKLINEVRDQLIHSKSNLESTITEKQTLLNDEEEEKDKLQKLKVQQSDLVSDLQKQENRLQSDINKYKLDIEKLDKLIADLVKKELESEKGSLKNISVDLQKLSSSFEGNKSKLPWPVTSGFISEKFGTNQHPVLKRVKVPNNGVNIQTNQNEKVRAVFNGKVKSVAIIPGDFKYVVIIQHGEYFTVYARMKEVYVKTGQEVKTNDVIGEVNTTSDGSTEIHFEVWKNTLKLDPEFWLAKR